MKKNILFFFLCFWIYSTEAQINIDQKNTTLLNADTFVGIDTFGALYYKKDTILYKEWNQQKWQFGDYTLGEITAVSILNPLKILLFYSDSNTILFLDKYFTEIKRINFNTITEFKNPIEVSLANDRNIWVFDTNTQRLELFDTESYKTLFTTQPIAELPIAQQSNFNYCWIITSKFIYQYNVYGSLLYKIENDGFTNGSIYNDGLLLQKEDDIYYCNPKNDEILSIYLPEITIKQFYVTNEILYIYDLHKIYSFHLTPKKN